jgi:hypothetical protein
MTNHDPQRNDNGKEKDADGLSNLFSADLLGLELERLAVAVTQSNARLLVGATTVVGNLLVGVNELVMGTLGSIKLGDTVRYSSEPRPASPPRAHTSRHATLSSGVVDTISGMVTEAIRESTDVVIDTARFFSRAYDDQLGQDWNSKRSPPGRTRG